MKLNTSTPHRIIAIAPGNRLVLCELLMDLYCRYVTWRCDSAGNPGLGHYHKDYDKAVADFKERMQ